MIPIETPLSKEVAIEDAELRAYMDRENADGAFDEKLYAQYLFARYEQVKAAYRDLLFQQAEVEGRGDAKQFGQKLSEVFHENYRQRKFLVKELRKRGEKVEDKFIL